MWGSTNQAVNETSFDLKHASRYNFGYNALDSDGVFHGDFQYKLPFICMGTPGNHFNKINRINIK